MKKFKLLSMASIRKNRGQVISYGIILIIAALLMNLGVITQLNYGKNFEKKWDELKVPSLFVTMKEGDYRKDYEEFAGKLEGITDTELNRGLIINCSMMYAGSKMSMSNVFKNIDDQHRMSDIRIVEELDKDVENPAYLSYFMKSGGGYKLGDKYIIEAGTQKYEFTVKGFVEDLQYGSPSLGIMEVKLKDKEYKALAEKLGKSAETVTLSAMSQDKTKAKAAFSKLINKVLSEAKQEVYGGHYELCKSTRTITANIGAAIIVSFSLIIVAVSLLVIHFRVSNSIEEEMQSMGALKAIGYTGSQVILSVLFPYIFIGAGSIILGALLSFAVLPLLKAGFDAQTGILWEQGLSITSIIITFTVIFTLVMLAAYSSARKIRKLQPITALRSGIQVHSFKRNYFPLERVPGNVNLLLALKSFIANTRQNILLLLVMASVTISALFAGVLYYNINVKSEVFLKAVSSGEMPEVSFKLNSKEAERIKREISNRPDVVKTLYYEVHNVITNGENMSAFVTEDYSKLSNVIIYKGRSPIHGNEVSIGGSAAKELGKTIGDTIKLSLGGKTEEYLITGLVQSTQNVGFVCEITTEGYRKLDSAYEPTWLFVYLKGAEKGLDGTSGVDTTGFIKTITEQYGNSIIANMDYVESAKSQMGIFKSIVSIIGSIILIITGLLVALIVYLIIKTLVVRRKQELGIQKSIGYTTRQLMLQMAFSFLPTVFIGVLIGGIIGSTGINPALTMMFRGIGIMKIKFLIPMGMSIMVAVTISLFAFAISLLVSRRIKRVSAYSLIRE